MTINTTTMPYLSFALIGSAGDNTTEMTSSIQSVSGTKASMTVPVTYKDTAGNTLLTSTKLDVGDGQSVGIKVLHLRHQAIHLVMMRRLYLVTTLNLRMIFQLRLVRERHLHWIWCTKSHRNKLRSIELG